ncbi:hypothetical protein [Thermus caliditerrae]|uniref:hypothetical protein n=1 Tax=Thermus caliditerrae TaxID=1330700 RepID=UPI001F17E2AE|nr:hypothetical protein [Thermus caliditerrae]
MEVLGNYWLRRILARIATVTVYEGQDTRTGTPVLVLKGAQGNPVQGEGILALLEETPEAWVLEWPIGAVPLSQYLGVADLERTAHWLREMAQLLAALEAQGVRYAPVPELCLVKGKRVWLAGVGLEALAGEGRKAVAALARALVGERWPEFPLAKAVEALESSAGSWEGLLGKGEEAPVASSEPSPEAQLPPREAPPPSGEDASPGPGEGKKRLSVEPVPEPEVPGPPQEPERPPSRPRVVRIEEREEPSFPVLEPSRERGPRLALAALLLAVLLLGGVGFWLLRPRSQGPGGYTMEFRTDPPTERAEVILLEVPEGSKMLPGRVLLTAPGRVEFDQKGVYRLRIRVAGRDPVDYLLEVPGPPLTIKVR